jgi:hypothetical protein
VEIVELLKAILNLDVLLILVVGLDAKYQLTAITLTVVGFVDLVINLMQAACNVLHPLHHNA